MRASPLPRCRTGDVRIARSARSVARPSQGAAPLVPATSSAPIVVDSSAAPVLRVATTIRPAQVIGEGVHADTEHGGYDEVRRTEREADREHLPDGPRQADEKETDELRLRARHDAG